MSSAKRTEIRGSRIDAIAGTLIGWFMRAWSKTLRFDIYDRCGVTTAADPIPPVIFALWHNRIFTMPPIWWRTGGNLRKSVVLTSASGDGSILAAALRVFDLGAVRGSSSRRGVAALVGMKKALKEGLDICITPDGPRGPRYSFQPGVIKLAQSSGAPIVPIHLHFKDAWSLKTWDGLLIPRPFSEVQVTFDELIYIPRTLDDAEFQAQVERVRAILVKGALETPNSTDSESIPK